MVACVVLLRENQIQKCFKRLIVTDSVRIPKKKKWEQRPVITDEGLKDGQHRLCSNRRATVSDYICKMDQQGMSV